MKRICFVLALLLAVSCSRVQEEPLTVISFNIRMGVADDGENSWENRREAVKAMIEAQEPDIFGLQEAYDFHVEYVSANCPSYGNVGVGREDGVHAGEHMSIFYDKDKISVEKWGTFWLSETPDRPSMGWDAACPRTATWALLKQKESGRMFWYVNTHLDHVGVQARKNGLALILERIADINPDGFPLVLTGDFNVSPDDESLTGLRQVMTDARQSAESTDSAATYNEWGNAAATIDYVFYSGFSGCLSFRTITESYAGKPYISDHYPVKAELTF